jgi:uncharacterized protein (DUF169 family)
MENIINEFEKYFRPTTFPLAIGVLKRGDKIPEKAKRPLRDLGVKLSICQVIGMARRYGWTIAVGPDDQSCPIAQVAFGFAPSLPYYEQGNLAAGMYCETLPVGAKAEALIPKLKVDEASTILIGPLGKVEFEPEVVVVYANSAQVMRLAAGAFYSNAKLSAKASPRADCAEIIIGTLHEGEAQVILPCYGDRVFGLTQDNEVCFTVPYSKLGELLKGLAGTEKAGIRYPIPANLKTEVEYPPKYQKLAAMWQQDLEK